MSRKISSQRATVRLGETFQASLCSDTAATCRNNLQGKLQRSTSTKSSAQIKAKIYILDELVHRKTIPLSELYQDYISKIPEQHHSAQLYSNNAIQSFVDSLTGSFTGLPVLIVRSKTSERTVLLFEEIGKNSNYNALCELDDIISKDNDNVSKTGLKDLQGCIKSHFNLLTSGRERAVVISLLSVIYSTTELRMYLGINERYTTGLKTAVEGYQKAAINQERKEISLAEDRWRRVLLSAEVSLSSQEEDLRKKHHRLSDSEVQMKTDDITFTQERITRLKTSKQNFVKRVSYLAMKKWKNTLRRQHGSKKGQFRIDRGAEEAVFKQLQEQLVAHVKRTQAPHLEQRVNKKTLRQMANQWLQEHGKTKIRSLETVRSWGQARRKGSIQSKQHRGRSLWTHKRVKKTYTEEHPNLHYNRAHIKLYHRQAFGKLGKWSKKMTLRRMMDDKAYLRCGTAEGFSRPRTKPLVLIDKQPCLPAYDFPEKAGYIAPGVHLIVRDMEETEVGGRDKYAITDATISIVCKPKLSYGSTATKWANDSYATRMEFPEEHEVEGTGMQECTRSSKTALIFLHDSLKQFSLMTLPDDYNRIESAESLERELLRVRVLICRLIHMLPEIQDIDICGEIHNILSFLQELELILTEGNVAPNVCEKFKTIKDEIDQCVQLLVPLTPAHRPIDIQTTDAGPGVGTSETLVRLRLVESFLINDLDIQARFHYAPRDSKAHPVERVMSSLNEACGDGRFIDIKHTSIMEDLGEEAVLKMSPDKLKSEKAKRDTQAAQSCAEEVATRYQGTRCMGTTIHARTPDLKNPFHTFFFDEEFMKECHLKKKSNPPGMGYYTFLCEKFDDIYIRYNNGVEGRRISGEWRSGEPVDRIPPPVPNYDDTDGEGQWHYHNLQTLPEDLSQSADRQPNDFCPIVQLQKYVADIGAPVLSTQKNPDGSVIVKDQNNTWTRIQHGIKDFVDKYLGRELLPVAFKSAESIYLREITKASKQLQKKGIQFDPQELIATQTGQLKVTISKTRVPQALPWNGSVCQGPQTIRMVNTCTIDNMLFLIHSLLLNRIDIRNFFESSDSPVIKCLLDVHKAFKDRKFAEGKLLWFHQFDDFQGVDSIDSHGSEDEFFYVKLREATRTTFTSKCSNKGCPFPETIHTSGIICFSMPVEGSSNGLQAGISHWMANSSSKPCTKQASGERCQGTRQRSSRVFVNGPPVLLPIEVSNCPYRLTHKIRIQGIGYTLQCITFGNGGHFVSNIKIANRWYAYDGLKEYHQTGTGLASILDPLSPPGQHFLQNYAIFVKDKN